MAQFFMGQYNIPVDPKGRIIMPASFRKALPPEADDTFVAAYGFEGCLSIYGLDGWKRYMDDLRRLSPNESRNRQFLRIVVSQAAEDKLDRQGRISIPRRLLQKAGIEDRATVVGMLDKVELWNPERYEEYMKNAEQVYDEVAEELGRSGRI